jgi:hypothetical protein
MSDPVEDFLVKLNGVRKNGGREEWSAKCPCRADDNNPSLSVGVGSQGQVLVTCHRGIPCSLDEICTAVGIEPSDLWPEDKESVLDRPKPAKKEPRPIKEAIQKKEPEKLELDTTYDYVDEHGELVMQVLRYRTEKGKTFRQRVPDGKGGWSWSTSDLESRPLYRLPEVLTAVAIGEPIWVVEGEKDADTLAGLGYAATCNPMGADNGSGNKWRAEHTAWLANAKVRIVSDNDIAGEVHSRYVKEQLEEAGARVKLVRPPDGSKDVTEMIESGLDLSMLTSDALQEVMDDPGASVANVIADLLADTRETLTTRLSKARRLLDGAEPQGSRELPGRYTTWNDLVSEADEEYKWLIPGVLEQNERVMIVAAEGVGKTMLARQVAICCAAGTHPFTMARMDPVRTLFVDLENPERIIRRTARKIVDNVKAQWPDRPTTDANLWIKPDGINVLNPRDRDRLEAIIEQARPQLLVMGPIYKMFVDPGSRSAESVTIEVAMYLDRIRETYGTALWLEHHAPLGNSLSGRDLRPMGSAVWMRWPEFGYALSPDPTAPTPEYEVKQWRGPRDLREWPARLRRGRLLPFEVVN